MEERHWDLPTPKIQRVLCGETGPQVDFEPTHNDHDEFGALG